MKAIVYTEYGPPEVLQMKQVEKRFPKNNEMLIKIKATAANSGDCRLRGANPFAVRFFFGLTKPSIHILGGVLSGEIEAIGKGVKLYKVGGKIFGSTICTSVRMPSISACRKMHSLTVENMNFLKELIESGKMKPVIDRTYPLERMAEAHAYVEKGHKKGNVAIRV